MEENNHNCAMFTLKIKGIDLQDVHLRDIAQVIGDFSRLLDDQSARFKDLSQGSVVLDVLAPQSAFPTILENIERNSHQSLFKSLKKYAQDFEIQLWAKANNDAPNQMIKTIVERATAHTFEQHEVIRGKLIKSAHGQNKTDHFTLLMPNEQRVSVKVSKVLSLDLAEHLPVLWREECGIVFTGRAKYQIEGFACRLMSFYAESFEILEQQGTLSAWAEAFTQAGDSGWRELDNPEALWLSERYQ